MANGFVRGLLLTQQQVYNGTAPSQKITPPGYLEMLLANDPSIVSATIDDGSGAIREVSIKYRPRLPLGQSGTTDDCSIQATPAYKEQDVPALSFRHLARFFDYNTLAKYEKEALTSINIGKPPVPGGIIMEVWNTILETANGLLGDVDTDLLTQQAAAFGTNQTTGATTAKTINFPLSTATNPLTEGMTMLIDDVMNNEIKPANIRIVGSGLINNAFIQASMNTSNTKDANWPTMIPKYYWDPYTAAKFGSNQFGVFEKNAVQFVNINKFNGFVGGDKMSTFLFTLTFPMGVTDSLGNSLAGIKLDVQLRHNDCPTETEINGVLTSVGRGWVVDLMMNYTQFNIPADAYDSTDRLTGNNGTLRYTATNA